MSCGSLDGKGVGGEWIHVYVWLSPLAVHLKTAQHHLPSAQLSSAQFSLSVVSDSLRPHESQHTRPPCPSPSPGVHSNSSPSSQWCHPAISSSVVPFSSCPQSLPASESFPLSQLFTWGGQSTGVSASASLDRLLKFCTIFFYLWKDDPVGQEHKF